MTVLKAGDRVKLNPEHKDIVGAFTGRAKVVSVNNGGAVILHKLGTCPMLDRLQETIGPNAPRWQTLPTAWLVKVGVR